MDAMRAVLRHREFRLLWLASQREHAGRPDRLRRARALRDRDRLAERRRASCSRRNAIPLVLFVLIGGVWADRLERHRVMVATDVVRALLHGTLAVLIFVGPVPIWAIVVIEAAFGTAEAFFNPAVTGLVPQTVPEGELQQANAANSDRPQRGRARRPGDRHRARARPRRGLGVRGRRADVRGLRAAARAAAPALARRARAERQRDARRAARGLARAALAPVGVGRDRRDVGRAAARARAVLHARADGGGGALRRARGVYGGDGGRDGRGDGARLARRAALAAAAPDPLRDGVGRAVAAGVRAVRARAAAVGGRARCSCSSASASRCSTSRGTPRCRSASRRTRSRA